MCECVWCVSRSPSPSVCRERGLGTEAGRRAGREGKKRREAIKHTHSHTRAHTPAPTPQKPRDCSCFMWGSSAGRDAGRERPGAGARSARAAGDLLGLHSLRELLLVSLELSAEPGPAPSWAPCLGTRSRGASPPRARGATGAAPCLSAALLPASPAVAACSHGKAARSVLRKSAFGDRGGTSPALNTLCAR